MQSSSSLQVSRLRKDGGFTLLEVAIAVVLILMVGTTAIASLRSGIRTLTGAEQSSIAVGAIRELREYTYRFTIEELDALHDTQMIPVLGNGEAMPGADALQIHLDVEAMDDLDPSVIVLSTASRTRRITAQAWSGGRQLLEAAWLATEH